MDSQQEEAWFILVTELITENENGRIYVFQERESHLEHAQCGGHMTIIQRGLKQLFQMELDANVS